MVSTQAQAQSAVCIPSVDRTHRDSISDVLDVTLAGYGNLSDAEIAAVVRDIAASRGCGAPLTTAPQAVGYYQRGTLQPRIAY